MTDYKKLNKLYNQAQELLSDKDISPSYGKLIGWKRSVERLLSKCYGSDSKEIMDFYD